MGTPEFYVFDNDEKVVLGDIVTRAINAEIYDNALDCYMDMSALFVHCPLRLSDLSSADNFNFGHDLSGIKRHLNRKTGKLENFFLPRFTIPSA